MQPRNERRIAIHERLDVLWIDVGAHHADRGVAPAIPLEERQGDRPGPGEDASGPCRFRYGPERLDVETRPPEDVSDTGELDHATLVVHVVADPRCKQIQSRDRADDLADVIRLEEMDQWVVLEDHRQARITAEEGLAHLGSAPGEPPAGPAGPWPPGPPRRP